MDAETTQRLEALALLGAVAPDVKRHIESLPPEEARKEIQRLLSSLARGVEAPGLSDSAAGGLAADILATPPTVAGSPEALRHGGDRDQSTLKLSPDPSVKAARDLVAAPPTIGGEAGANAPGAAPGPAAYERLLGPYGIVRELGRGAMGVVYLAEDRELRRLVALKVLPRGVTDDRELLERFRREASACASLSHPNVVSVMGMGQAEDLHYYAMEYVEGKSLADVIAKERITPERAAVLIRQAAEGLGHAHAKGVIHRDVKPANMIVTVRVVEKPDTKSKRERSASKAASTSWRDSEVSGLVSLGLPRGGSDSEQTAVRLIEDFVKVADFGLARVEGGKTLTATGHVMGTPAYMAPEQARGAKDEVGPASDVYSLGATLYEMLTGKRPFDAETMPVLIRKILTEDPPRPRSLAPTLDRDLETITLKCLEKDPSKRYAHAGKLAEDLGRWLRDEPIHARPVRWPGRVWRRVRRNRAVAGLTAGLLVCVLAVIGVTLQYTLVPKLREAARQRQEAHERAERKAAAETLLARARAASDGKRPDEAARLANELLAAYADWAEKGEDLPISAAHALLGDVHRAKEESKPALVEFYRAFEASIGTPRAAETLVRVGDQLYEMEEFEKAQGTYERALEEGTTGRTEFQARYGVGRCLLSLMHFDEAHRWFAALEQDPASTTQEREKIADCLGWLGLVGSPVEIPMPFRTFVAAQMQQGGLTELVGVAPNGRDVLMGHFDGKSFVEESRITVLTTEAHLLGAVDALDIDGDGIREILAAGGDADRGVGTLAVLRRSESEMTIDTTTQLGGPMSGSIGRQGFAIADVDGDDIGELIVGTGMYERALRIYQYDRTKRHLKLLALVPMGGDVGAVLARDVNHNGRDEIWAFVGPWRAYALVAVEFDPATRQFTKESTTRLASFVLPDESAYVRCDNRFLVTASWWQPCIGPLRELYGKRFESTFHPTGVYELRLRDDLGVDVNPLWSRGWDFAADLGVVLARFPTGAGDFAMIAWRQAGYLFETPSPDGSMQSPIGLFREGDGGWHPVCRMSPSTAGYTQIYALDLDGDADSELVRYTGSPHEGAHASLVVSGLHPANPPSRHISTPAAAGTTHIPRRPVPTSLVAAREAERLGLDEQVVHLAERLLDSAPDAESLEETFRILVGALVRLHRTADALQAGDELAARHPTLKAVVLRTLLDATERQGLWHIAESLARSLLTVPDLRREEIQALERSSSSLRALDRPTPAFDLARGDMRTCDLLATTPYHFICTDERELAVTTCSQGFQGLFFPVEYDCSNYRLDIQAAVGRIDWGCKLNWGVIAGDPAAFGGRPSEAAGRGGQSDLSRPMPHDTLYLSAHGETASPMTTFAALSSRPGDLFGREVDSGLLQPGEPIQATLEFAPHQQLLRCSASSGSRSCSVQLRRSPITDDVVYCFLASLEANGTPRFWGRTRVERLWLGVGGGSARLASIRPRSPTDLLFLGNGRYVQGRIEDAQRLYDEAVAAGDLEAGHESRLKANGVPSLFDLAWTEVARRWVSVDARLWRGLLRAEQGDDAGAREDIEGAFTRSEERATFLLRTSALPLADHAKACTALREFLMKRAGADTSTGLQAFAEKLLEDDGPYVVDALLADVGLHAARYAVIASVQVEEGECPLKPGDIVTTYDGRPITTWPEVRRFHAEARDAEKTSVQVVVVRDGKTLTFDLDPRPVMLSAQELQRVERLPGK